MPRYVQPGLGLEGKEFWMGAGLPGSGCHSASSSPALGQGLSCTEPWLSSCPTGGKAPLSNLTIALWFRNGVGSGADWGQGVEFAVFPVIA